MTALLTAALGFAVGGASGWYLACRRFERNRRRDGKFLSFVAHELNTPLTAMHMTVLNFVRGVFGPLPKEHEQWLKILAEQTTRLADLVGDLRDLIHIEFHRDFRLHITDFDLKEALLRSAETVESGLERMGAPLTVTVPDGLPKVRGDLERLRRVFDDVLSHAKKFRQRGGISLEAAPKAGLGVEVTVRFQGPIVDRVEAGRMTELYYVVDRPKTTILSSIGLGLGICRLIVEKCEGTFFFDCSEGGKTRIVVLLRAAGSGAA